MDAKLRLLEISSFLEKYHYLWEIEILERYPHPFPEWLNAYIDELNQLNDQQLLALENNLECPRSLDKTAKLCEEIKQLCEIPQKMTPQEFYRRGVKSKKLHEIGHLKGALPDKKFHHIYDFAAGIGHFSEALADHYQCQVTSFDFDPALQETGRSRTDKVTFKQMDILKDKFQEQTSKDDLFVGLHSCGELSIKQMFFFNENEVGSLVNIPCCYHKLNPDNLYLSSITKVHPLRLHPYSLMLAARSNATSTIEEFSFRRKMKSKRYLFHMFCLDNNLTDKFEALGPGDPADYEKSFSDYALSSFKKLGVDFTGKVQLEDYYEQNLQIFEKFFRAHQLRLLFGRVVELYLVLDRVVFLEESGHQVELFEVFDKEISPRNLLISCNKT